MSHIPEYFTVSTPELFVAAITLLKQEVPTYQFKPNTYQLDKERPGFLKTRDFVIRVNNNEVSWAGNFTVLNPIKENGPYISSLSELYKLLVLPPIKIGEHIVDFSNPKGVQVGCTKVSWETIEEILARKPKF